MLAYASPYQLLIGVILSAQTTDRQVNRVTPELFKRFPTPGELASGNILEIEEIIRSTGFYKMKARHIKGTAEALTQVFGGQVPDTMEDLLTLPGVGRKSANVVLAHCFGRPAIITDTHFIRVTNRLGLVNTDDPGRIEEELRSFTPGTLQTDISMFLNYLGRDRCFARKPDCSACPLKEICPSAGSLVG